MPVEPWYQNIYRRNVLDMHISDIDDRFMGRFDSERYVDDLVRAQVQSTVFYAHSHAGLCFYPSKIGPMHNGLCGRNIVAEVVNLCRKNGIAVVLYLSMIYDTWAYRAHKDWRIIGAEGQAVADHSRYGVCCPNTPYRDYAAALTKEVCETFDVQGIRFDMTFWPAFCYCSFCQQRWMDDRKEKIPKVIDWQNPLWVHFMRQREAWLVEFAARQTAIVKNINPSLSVEHQASTYPLSWRVGVTTQLVEHNDFLQGDFYGDALQGSFVRKLFYNLSPSRPAGFETSIGVNLQDYTALKAEELLHAKASAALADGSAFVFIDTIDPCGTMNPEVYKRMNHVFSRTQVYEQFLGGEPCQDVAVYLSTVSKFDPADNGKAVNDPYLSPRVPHIEAALSACKSLLDHHVPFTVITDRNLNTLSKHKVVVLPNLLMVNKQEMEAFRSYVRDGGTLYASKMTSLVTSDGMRHTDLILGDVLGIAYREETKETFTYIAPAKGYEWLYSTYTRQHPPGLQGSQLIVKTLPGAQVLGELVLPYTDPADPINFASIHNNPPGIYTGNPAIVLNHFGRGRTLYVSGDLETAESHRDVFINLIRLLCDKFSFEMEAPKSVEITVFDDKKHSRYIVNLVNFQKEMPNIPVENIRVSIRLDDKIPGLLLVLPEKRAIPYTIEDNYAVFTAPCLETYAMMALEYKAIR